jgi:hypothetical protein
MLRRSLNVRGKRPKCLILHEEQTEVDLVNGGYAGLSMTIDELAVIR